MSAAEIRTLKAIHRGWRRHGKDLVPGQPLGHEEGWETFLTGSTPPTGSGPGVSAAYGLVNEFLRYFVLDDPQTNLADFSIRRHIDRIESFRATLDATDPDLSAFARRGGKLVVTHGWADPALNPLTAIRYHSDVTAALGHRARNMIKLYMVPGMFHCASGPGLTDFDALSVVEQWVREGVAPGPITATDDRGRTAPLCPHPSRPRPTLSSSQLWRCGL